MLPLRTLPGTATTTKGETDPVLQSLLPLPTMPAPALTLPGLGFNDACLGGQCGAGWPPDPNGDAGLNYYVQAVNTSIGVFSKATGERLLAIRFDQFWSAAGGTGTRCDNSNIGDPVVLFDQLSQRWLITDFAFDDGTLDGPFYECIAVSKTEDPLTGGWWFYPMLVDVTSMNDYPKFGLWPDGYYMTANMFQANGTRFAGARSWALDRSKMISGQPVTPQYFNTSIQYGSLLPGTFRGYPPPAGSPALFLALDIINKGQLLLWRFHFDPATPANSWFGGSGPGTAPKAIRVASYASPCGNQSGCIPQPGTPQRVDAIGDRLMMPLQYQNLNGLESLWAAHTVAGSSLLDSRTGIRWYEIRDPNGVPWVRQQSTFKPADGIFRWLPSLAVDKSGNVAVGYNASSKGLFPSIRVNGRKWTDPLGTLKQGETVMQAGSGSQEGGNGPERWGDYSSMVLDPVDGCTFWYTNEYFVATGPNWQTRIGSFKYPDCGTLAPLDEVDLRVQYGGWKGVSNAKARGRAYRYSETAGDTASLRFTGSAITWNYITGPDGGKAQVLIDGKAKGLVDQYSASIGYGVSRRFGGLSTGSHTLTIKVQSTPNPLSTGNKVVVDSLAAVGTTFQESAVAITWNGWRGARSANAVGGKYRYSQTPGDTLTVPFWGDGIAWTGSKGPNHGQAQILVDDVDYATVNLYNPSMLWKQSLQSISGLADGYHTIKIIVLSSKDPASSGTKVSLDSIQVTQP
ncbi:MAG: hypothetical protein ACM3JD_02435 [Rudaea sp.]